MDAVYVGALAPDGDCSLQKPSTPARRPTLYYENLGPPTVNGRLPMSKQRLTIGLRAGGAIPGRQLLLSVSVKNHKLLDIDKRPPVTHTTDIQKSFASFLQKRRAS
jgi:hypothetical protein